MRKSIKKLLCLTLSCALLSSLVLPTMAGCDRAENVNNRFTEEEKKNMTQLIVGVYDGGFGTSWADKIAVEFEKKFADYSFEANKTGVYVDVQGKKSGYDPNTLKANITGGVEIADIYYTSSYIDSFIDDDIMYDITGVYEEKVYDDKGNYVGENGTKSLLDRTDEYYVDAYNLGTEQEPAYYALPYEDTYKGFVYDHDLFEQKGWLNYSGIDGTPKTTTEFLDLLMKISQAQMIPYTLSTSDASFYYYNMFYSFMAQYEGLDNAWLNLTLDGEYTFPANTFTEQEVADYNLSGSYNQPITVTITPENGYLLAYQPGRKALADFIRLIANPTFYDPNCVGMTQTFAETQKSFVLSKSVGKRIAMIFDGEWWEHEAKEYFDDASLSDPTQKYGTRDFRMMAVPMATGGKNEEPVMITLEATVAFANKKTVEANTAKQDLISKWFQFQYDRSGLVTYTKEAGGVLAYKYEATPEELNSFTSFSRSIYNMKNSDTIKTARIGMNHSSVNEYTKISTLPMGGFGLQEVSWYKIAQNRGDANIFGAMINDSTLTAAQWIAGVRHRYNKSNWDVAYNRYIENQSK